MRCRIKSAASAEGKKGRKFNDSDEMPILMDNKRSDSQPMTLLMRANVSTETVRALSTVGKVYSGRAKNTAWRTSEAGAKCARWDESEVREGGRGERVTYL